MIFFLLDANDIVARLHGNEWKMILFLIYLSFSQGEIKSLRLNLIRLPFVAKAHKLFVNSRSLNNVNNARSSKRDNRGEGKNTKQGPESQKTLLMYGAADF